MFNNRLCTRGCWGEQRERGGGAGGQAEAGPVHCGGPSLLAPAQVQHRVQDPQGADQIQGEGNNILGPVVLLELGMSVSHPW